MAPRIDDSCVDWGLSSWLGTYIRHWSSLPSCIDGILNEKLGMNIFVVEESALYIILLKAYTLSSPLMKMVDVGV